MPSNLKKKNILNGDMPRRPATPYYPSPFDRFVYYAPSNGLKAAGDQVQLESLTMYSPGSPSEIQHPIHLARSESGMPKGIIPPPNSADSTTSKTLSPDSFAGILPYPLSPLFHLDKTEILTPLQHHHVRIQAEAAAPSPNGSGTIPTPTPIPPNPTASKETFAIVPVPLTLCPSCHHPEIMQRKEYEGQKGCVCLCHGLAVEAHEKALKGALDAALAGGVGDEAMSYVVHNAQPAQRPVVVAQPTQSNMNFM